MTQVKTKFDANTGTSKIIWTFCHFGNLFKREGIWIQYFHLLNITSCGKYPCAFVMPERYFVFTCCSANPSISISARRRKRKKVDPCACVCVKAVFTLKSVRIMIFTFLIASLVKTRLKWDQNAWFILLNEQRRSEASWRKWEPTRTLLFCKCNPSTLSKFYQLVSNY